MSVKNNVDKTYVDFISEFSGGMNSGISPTLLQKNQISFGLNCSIRNGFIKNRPPIQKKNFDYNGNSDLQTIVETGIFQGAGYYRPDYGTESLIAQISGHLVLFTEIGNSWLVEDVSIPGDLNNPTVNQVWMWQSEKWMIIQDGTTANPIFFDGKTSRRSYGNSTSIATSSSSVVVPPIGNLVKVQTFDTVPLITANLIIFNGEYYAMTGYENTDAYFSANLKTIYLPSNQTIPNGTPVYAVPNAVYQSSTISSATIENQVVSNTQNLIKLKLGYVSVPQAEGYALNNGSSAIQDYGNKNIAIFKENVSAVSPYIIPAGTQITIILDSEIQNVIGTSVSLVLSQSYKKNDYSGYSEVVEKINSTWTVLNQLPDNKTIVIQLVKDVIGAYEYNVAASPPIPASNFYAREYAGTFSDTPSTYPVTYSQTQRQWSFNYFGNEIVFGSQSSYDYAFNWTTTGPFKLPRATVIGADYQINAPSEPFTSVNSYQQNVSKFSVVPNQKLNFSSYQPPNYILGSVAETINPAKQNQSIAVKVSFNYASTSPQTVKILDGLFSLTGNPPTAKNYYAILQNISDANVGQTVASGTPLITVPEIPSGRMGAYGMGCNAVCKTDGVSYIISDVIGSGSGTPQNNYRDAVLKITQNNFLASGGSFRLPGTGDIISSIVFPPIMDTALGQGPLQVGTPFAFYSNNVPGTNPAGWGTVTFPIQTQSLKDKGPLGANSTIVVNSDTFFRSFEGIGSMVLARRDFGEWGNKSISNEIQRILKNDNQSLLSYGSSLTFDNRMLMTASPNVSEKGVFHVALVSLNFDLSSSLRGSIPPAWEGAWTGVNALQIVTGRINAEKRAFAFTFNIDNKKIELYEFLPEKTTEYLDNGTTPIVWVFETPTLFNSDIKPIVEVVQLRDGEVYLGDIKGNVNVKVYYRPDYYPCWILWNEFNVCQSSAGENSNSAYRMRVGLGEPSQEDCEIGNNNPLRQGCFFQFRYEITGSCTFKGMKVSSVSIPQATFASVECDSVQCQEINCKIPEDLRIYSLQGLPTVIETPKPEPKKTYSNQIVYYSFPCSTIFIFIGIFPTWISYDSVNQKIVGIANVFTGTTQESADSQAQEALNSFVNSSISAGVMYCAGSEPPACTIGNANQYKIDGYSSTMFQNPAPGGEPGLIWDGVFRYKQTGEDCRWGGNTNAQFISIGGHSATCCEVLFLTNKWVFRIYYYGGSAGILMVDYQKLVGTNPEGSYTLFNKAAGTTQPDTINIVPNGLTTTNVTLQGCS